jgi:hypothetical protein
MQTSHQRNELRIQQSGPAPASFSYAVPFLTHPAMPILVGSVTRNDMLDVTRNLATVGYYQEEQLALRTSSRHFVMELFSSACLA